MLRQLHSIPGYLAAIFVIILAVSGSIMSIEPALDKLNAGNAGELNVAQMADLVAKNHQGIELITRSANGTIAVQYYNDDGPGNDIIDPQTGLSLQPKTPSPIFAFFKLVHRTFYVGITGRIVAGITAFIMFMACFSGLFMLAKRMGGWRQIFHPAKGSFNARQHVDISRVVILGLLLTAFTGTYMSLTKFGFIDDGKGEFLAFPETIGNEPIAIAELLALKNTPLSRLRELRFPFEDDPYDVFTIITEDGQGYVDQATGEFLVYQANSFGRNIFEFFYMLHTGQGLWWLGILLGFSALGLPIMAVTGTLIWWKRRSSSPKTSGNIAANKAKNIILVGSESNVTWGFAKHLHQKLTKAGVQTHIAEMNAFKPENYTAAEKIYFITATYGDGTAPETANKFLKKLADCQQSPNIEYAVLGFGDKQFDQFAKFAIDVDAALTQKGWKCFLPIELIDRQSSQAFENWGIKLSQALNLDFALNHIAAKPKTFNLKLQSAEDFTYDGKYSTRILHFALPANMAKFEAGDLVGIMPPNSQVARYYSLATSHKDGSLGICVAKKHGGLCSPFLHELAVGDEVEAYIQINAHFRPAANDNPYIMVGAGTGIAPFIGFIANNIAQREAHLYWGGRHPDADFLYQDNLQQAVDSGSLNQLTTAFSRAENGTYVQHKLAKDAKNIRNIMAKNGQIIVCGGRDMAVQVKQTFAEMGLDIDKLQTENRYIEDVY